MRKLLKNPQFGAYLLLTFMVLLAVVHLWMPFALYGWSWIINFLPLLLVSGIVLWRAGKYDMDAGTTAVIIGMTYGIFAGVLLSAGLGFFATLLGPSYLKHPYDQAALGIIMALCAVLMLTVFVVDLIKTGDNFTGKRFLLQFLIMITLALPICLPAMTIMEYFEGIFSKFVS